MKVVLDEQSLISFTINVGVPQGFVLGRSSYFY